MVVSLFPFLCTKPRAISTPKMHFGNPQTRHCVQIGGDHADLFLQRQVGDDITGPLLRREEDPETDR